ncbi:Piwi-domain-containing protein [Gigaspora margarita]|uniref:Piwi-domain-containing protein n=1 Tax=Gigaspora margarita TaxID=4874 RepID=A0A8H4B024_GIGMA|nr:Piwi-domain-containing protein [Gigaspora margarita]
MSSDIKNKIALRPSGPATRGELVEVTVNYVEIAKSFKYPTVYSYSFEATTQQRKKAKREEAEEVFYQLLKNNEFGQNVFPVYDGNMIYSCNKLCGGKDNKKFYSINIPPKDDAGRAKSFSAMLKSSNKCETYQMSDYVKVGTNQRWGDDIQNNLRVLNTFINSDVRSQYLTHGRKQIFPKPNPQNRLYLPDGIELMIGFYQSVRPGWDKLLINIDICATTFYPSGPLIELIPKILATKKSKDDLRRGLSKDEIKNLERFIKGISFTTTYRSSNNSKPKKKASYITEKSAQQLKFRLNDQIISVSEYYRNSGTPLEFSMLPCIVVKSTKRGQNDAYFPLEICSIISGQKFKVDDLNKAQRQDMIKKTAIKPADRFQRINNGLTNVYKHSENNAMKSIGMVVGKELMKTISRVLDPPKLTATPNNIEIIPESGSWSVPKFIAPAGLHSWSIVCFDPELKKQHVEGAIRTLMEVLVEKGLKVNPPLKMIPGNPQNCKEALTLAAQRGNPKLNPQLIVCILASKVNGMAGIYADIKRTCLVDLGINSQCFQSKEIGDRLWRQICHNVALKINGKLGGTNSRLIQKQLDFKDSKRYMIIGADVFHPSKEDKRKGRPSTAAIVASMDQYATKYVGRYSMNKKLKNEVIEEIDSIVIDFVKLFEEKSKKFLPEAILFYRDGVAEGQFEIIMENEVAKLIDALKDFYKSRGLSPPKLTFVIMQKRHHTRAKPNDESKADPKGNGNCKPGTIIDKDIVVPQYFTFFLQSHSSPLGTARPAYYHVIYDETGFSQDEMHTLTYNLCFSSVRCNLALSMVTPLHYAHNLANLAKNFVTYKEFPVKAAGRGGRQPQAPAPADPEFVQEGKVLYVHDNIKNSMYFA